MCYNTNRTNKPIKQTLMFTLKYKIPNHQPTKQRKSNQTITNLSKKQLAPWIAYLNNRKINATYSIT